MDKHEKEKNIVVKIFKGKGPKNDLATFGSLTIPYGGS
jgi:hypothetical protein